MAIGKESDFVIFEDEFFSGMTEVDAQHSDAFNAASNQCIQLRPNITRGNYTSASFIDVIATSTLIARRDLTSVSTKTDTPLTMDQINAVKLSRIIGPVAQNISAWKKTAPNEDAQRLQSFLLGKQIAKGKATEMLNSALGAAEAAIGNVANLTHSAPTTTLTHALLNTMLSKAGDSAQDIECFVMHSASWFHLTGAAIGTNGFDGIATGVIIQGASPGTFGRPVVITDSAGLSTGTGSTLLYQVLGLRRGGIVIEESEETTMVSELVTGLDNLAFRIQGEFGYNLSIKGFKWDIGNGGANPTDASLITGSNWDKAVTSDKNLAGVHMDVDFE